MRISDWSQTCALPISGHDIIAGVAFTFLSGNATANSSATATAGEEGFGLAMAGNDLLVADKGDTAALFGNDSVEIGRASCRERVCQYVEISVVAVSLKKKKKEKSIIHRNVKHI